MKNKFSFFMSHGASFFILPKPWGPSDGGNPSSVRECATSSCHLISHFLPRNQLVKQELLSGSIKISTGLIKEEIEEIYRKN